MSYQKCSSFVCECIMQFQLTFSITTVISSQCVMYITSQCIMCIIGSDCQLVCHSYYCSNGKEIAVNQLVNYIITLVINYQLVCHVYYYSNHKLVCHVLNNWVTGVMSSRSAVVFVHRHLIYEGRICADLQDMDYTPRL